MPDLEVWRPQGYKGEEAPWPQIIFLVLEFTSLNLNFFSEVSLVEIFHPSKVSVVLSIFDPYTEEILVPKILKFKNLDQIGLESESKAKPGLKSKEGTAASDNVIGRWKR
ncbi:hypothetical protein EVAR_92650_1 [Eumeta japonica]|uniref:Uncharacterized protein n=1 Tax=Eumeta variegata TaxID=151549 RepID=A0A4C1SZK3_EUMVA|nr:hypothetical protein EVAR_92650_1 [Eumeta japonica]